MTLLQQLTDEELLIRLRSEEDNFVERKASANTHDVRRTVVAFANTVRAPREGVLFLGVNDKNAEPNGKLGEVEKTQQKVRGWIDECYPPIPYYARVLTIEGKDVLAVVVTERKGGPYFAGPSWVRVGPESVKASEKMLQRLVEDRLDPVRLLRDWEGKLVTLRERDAFAEQFQSGRGRATWSEEEARLLEVNAYWVIWEQVRNGAKRSASIHDVVVFRDTKNDRLALKIKSD